MRYKQLKYRHPEYDAKYWRKCRAFYAGGKRLLEDRRLMKECFPRHLSETPTVYKERCDRAFYIPYAGEIINSLVAGLFGEELKIEGDPKPDEFYDDFWEDCSPPGGRRQTLNELLKQQVLTSLLCRRAWTLVDLPDVGYDENGPVEFVTAAQEEEAGALDAYAVPIDPEMVLDWEESEDGELIWALILNTSQRRDSIEADRSITRDEYTYYTADTWERYVVEYAPGKEPQDEEEIDPVAGGAHTFGRVPLARLEVDEGMWAMGKILPIAIAHFNLRNALSWAEYKSLFPVLAAFKQPMDPLNPNSEDPDRDVNQVYGQGRVVGFANQDRLEYVGPDSGPFGVAMQDLNNLRDEMHRVLHHMALSVDNSAAALQRSAENKQVDQAATAIILRALGLCVREHTRDIYELVESGRVEDEHTWTVEGMEKFDEINVDSLVTQAETVDTVSIPSATFKQRWTYMLARRLLGDTASQEDLDAIKKELEENITNEQFEMPLPGATGGFGAGDFGGDDDDDDDDLEVVGQERRPAPNGRPQRRGFSSAPKP